jgi:hypothetical protein
MSNDDRSDLPSRQSSSRRQSYLKDKKQQTFFEEERHQRGIERSQDKELVVDWRMKQRVCCSLIYT